jgi:elongation factor G
MAALKTEQIRNIAVIGAGGAGKTSLVDALLFKAGTVSRQGKVDDGTSLSDYTAEEKEVKHSLHASLLSLEHKGAKVNLLDTPGYSDFVGEAGLALGAADMALVVVSAVTGINASTRRLYHTARDMRLPMVVVVNRLDSDQAHLEETLESIGSMFGTECCPILQPDAVGPGFSRLVSLLDAAEAAGMEEQRGALVDSLVETDEEAMERYLEEGEVSDEELRTLLHRAVIGCAFVPVVGCSVSADVGVAEILDLLVDVGPSPLEGPGRGGRKGGPDGEEVRVKPGEWAAPCVQVFKTVSDPYVGKLSFVRVWGGEMQSDHPLTLARTGKDEKLQNLLSVQGKDTESIPAVMTGDLAAVAKVENLETGDTLYSGEAVVLDPIQVPPPMVSLAIEPTSRGEEQKLSTALKKLAGEDLTFHVERDATTHELVVSGITNLHLETHLKRLKDQFGVEVQTRIPRVPLKETVMAAAEGHHRHKKQTGGAGQFGEVYLRIRPNERGQGFEFVDKVVGGSIPKNFLPAVEKGIRESLESGVFAGYPVVDVIVEVYDGKHHPVDSNETSFKAAGSRAFKDAFLKAKPCLLEPIVDLEVEVPASAMGDINGDLNSRRGRIQGMDSVGNLQIIKAQVPLKEIQTYSTDLRSMTAGEGSYTFTFSHYDVVPAKVAEEIRAGFKAKDED